MKILQMSAYCDPEQISSSHLTDDLYDAFSKNDISVEDYVPTPCRGVSKEVRNKYKKIRHEEKFNGHYIINRFPMFSEGKNPIIRALRYILVNIIQYFKGTRAKNVDVIFAGSTPPTQGLLCGLVKKRLKVPFVYNLQDIFPDSLVNAGMTKKGSLIWKIGRKIEDFTYRSADKIIVISDDFKRNIMEKGVPEDKIVVIPNWVNTDNVYPVDRKDNILFDRYNLDRSKFYICYSGNLGHSQNLELLVQVAEEIHITMPDVIFVLIGEGAAKVKVEATICDKKLDNIIVLPFQPYEDIAHVFSLGDAGLIISKPGIGGSSVPSKTWSIMAAARPIIASFDIDSELANVIREANCGVVVKPDSEEDLCETLKIFFNDNNTIIRYGENGKQYIKEKLNKDVCVKKYVDVIRKVKRGYVG